MAKAKGGKTTTAGGSSKKVKIIASVLVLAIIITLSIVIGVTFKRSNANAYGQGTFYVDVNGSRYYEDGAITLKRSSITEFKCGYVGDTSNADKLYNVKITSTSTDETAFTYTLDGARRMFLNGEDYTNCFDISESASTFEIAHVKDTPATVLQRRYPGKTVKAPETDPTISYFKLTVSSADNSQSVSFALTFGDLIIEFDPSGGIIF